MSDSSLFLRSTMAAYTEIVKGGNSSDPVYLLNFDGGAQPNPGRGGSAAAISDSSGTVLYECGEYHPHATNNAAEYGGLIIGLRLALKKGIVRLLIQGDSNLVISQICGRWSVNNPKMKGLYNEARGLILQFQYVACKHVYRSSNAHADALSDEVIFNGRGFERDSSLAREPNEHTRLYDYDEALWRLKLALDRVVTETDEEAVTEIRAILERTRQ